MSNLLNSQISSNTNPIPARKISQDKASRCVQAPQSIYTYSIDKVLNEKDEFRKNVELSQYNQLYAKKRSTFPKLCVILAALTAYFTIKCKK